MLAVAHVALSLVAITRPYEVMYGEAIIHDHAARLLRGEPLYQLVGEPPYTVAAYTPLYYVLAAGLQAAFGPGFAPGRALSLGAGLGVAYLVARLAGQATGSRRWGTFAALLFLALGIPSIWAALYKEDVLGVVLSVGAIAALADGTGSRRLVLAATLAALAFLTKQVLVAAGLAGVVWLWGRDRTRAVLFAGIGLSIVLGTSIALEFATGAYLANIIFANVNPISGSAVAQNLKHLLLHQIVPLSLGGLYLPRSTLHRPTENEGLLVVFWVASLLPLVGLAKVGSNANYWIEAAAASSVVAVICLNRFLDKDGEQRGRWTAIVPILLLVAQVGAVVPMVGLSASARERELRASDSRGFDALVERVRAEPGEVLADPLDVVVLAGRPVLLEPYLFSIFASQGVWDPEPLVGRIRAGEVGLLVLDLPLESDGHAYHGFPHWPPAVLAALRETMVLDRRQAGRFLYVPRVARSGVEPLPVADRPMLWARARDMSRRSGAERREHLMAVPLCVSSQRGTASGLIVREWVRKMPL